MTIIAISRGSLHVGTAVAEEVASRLVNELGMQDTVFWATKLNVAGRGVNMGDGWETARRRGPGNDWVIFELGHAGAIDKVEVDTAHFKGNYPDRVSLDAAMFSSADEATPDSDAWQTLLPESRLEMDKQHFFDSELNALGPVSHVRMSIYPDGGISRVRLFGHIRLGDTT